MTPTQLTLITKLYGSSKQRLPISRSFTVWPPEPKEAEAMSKLIGGKLVRRINPEGARSGEIEYELTGKGRSRFKALQRGDK